jgi:DNA repair exonuclease SbcCD ATPase subunit
MRITRIAVRNFCKLTEPLVITGFGKGITVIAGDNEEGKSTLLHAIRAVLFERHNVTGKAAEAMQPFSSLVRPEIQLDFEIDGQGYRIKKAFIVNPCAVLTTANGSFEGPYAEEQLARLLTFRVPARGESKPDDHGILGLFWLEQARSIEGLRIGETGRSTIRNSLIQEVGDVLGGSRGRKILDAATAGHGLLLTAKGKPRSGGELDTANREAEAANRRFLELERERQEYEEEIEQLAILREDLNQLETGRVVEKAHEEVRSSEEQIRAIESLRQKHRAAVQNVELSDAHFRSTRDKYKRRQELINSIENGRQDVLNLQSQHDRLQLDGNEVLQALETAKAQLSICSQQSRMASSRLALSQAKARLVSLNNEIEDLEARLDQVKSLNEQLSSATQRLSQHRLDQNGLDSLVEAERIARETQLKLDATVTRVCFKPISEQRVWKDSELVSPQRDVRISEATLFTLEGFGTVEVTPGESDFQARQKASEKADNAFRVALDNAGVFDLNSAKAVVAARRTAEAQIKEVKGLITAYAPNGVDALKIHYDKQVLARQKLSDATNWSELPDLKDPDTETSLLASSKEAESSARETFDDCREKLADHRTRVATALQALNLAKAATQKSEETLVSDRLGEDDEDTARDLQVKTIALQQAAQEKTKVDELLAAANPSSVERRLGTARSALQLATDRQRTLRESIVRAESRLSALGKNGIGEQLEDARGQNSQCILRRERLQKEGRAWTLLVETLVNAEREAKEAFLEPVLQYVHPFLAFLLPNAHLILDKETLEITGVSRNGQQEPYRMLSVGTREQLSVLVRLAFATYLREKNFPAAVILDDSLVYADDKRFARMLQVLRKAAETVQIIILTCRPRDWQTSGFPIRELSDPANRAVTI